MGHSHRAIAAVCVFLLMPMLLLGGCSPADSDVPQEPPSTGNTSAPSATSDPSTSTASTAEPNPAGTASPSDVIDPSPGGEVPTYPSPMNTSAGTPVPKVMRSGEATPSISAEPVDIDDDVTYSDGVQLHISDITFGTETEKGPGRFPGREFAVLDLEIDNGSDRSFSLNTVIVTVLDPAGNAVPPVFVEGMEVTDFAGDLLAGDQKTARYAFAVPKSSRSLVTVVVDFDDVHTSAVFRGQLS